MQNLPYFSFFLVNYILRSHLLTKFYLFFLLSCNTEASLISTTADNSLVCSRSNRTSCSHQIRPDFPKDNCILKSYYKNPSSECIRVFNEHNDLYPPFEDHGIHLEVYHHELEGIFSNNRRFHSTALNLTAQNIPQGKAVFNFRDPVSHDSSHCFIFELKNSGTNKNFTLWHDCVFRDRGFEGAPYILEYVIGNQRGKFDFIVPKERDLELNPVFLYVRPFDNGRLVLTFQVNYEGVNEYKATILSWAGKYSSVISAKNINLTDTSSFVKKWKNLVTVSLDNELSDGNYSVVVQCSQSLQNISSPFIIIQRSQDSKLPFLLAAAACLVLLVPVVYYCIRKCRKIPRRNISGKTLVLIYNPVSRYHCTQVEALKAFLHKICHIDVYLDVVDISETEHMDPVKWYATVMSEATHAAVIVAPSLSNDPPFQSIYQKTYNLALQLMGPRIGNDLNSNFLILLENSCKEQIPDTCLPLKKFKIPRDVLKLQKFLHCKMTGGLRTSYFEEEFKNCLLAVQQKTLPRSRMLMEKMNLDEDLQGKDTEWENYEKESEKEKFQVHYFEDEADETDEGEESEESASLELNFV